MHVVVHHLTDRMTLPFRARKALQGTRRDIALQVAVGCHRKDLAMVAIDIIFHPAPQIEHGRYDNRLTVHELTDRLAFERLADDDLLVTLARRIVQEEADQAKP